MKPADRECLPMVLARSAEYVMIFLGTSYESSPLMAPGPRPEMLSILICGNWEAMASRPLGRPRVEGLKPSPWVDDCSIQRFIPAFALNVSDWLKTWL